MKKSSINKTREKLVKSMPENMLKGSKKKIIITLLILLSIVLVFKRSSKDIKGFNIDKFDIEKIQKGNITKTVTANGTINPVNVIHVGTQVSGTIKKIFVDYNDRVREDQVLAELDKSILEEKVKEALSELRKAKKNLEFIELDAERARELFKKNYIAKVELDQSENELISAQEEYKITESRYEVANKNLDYAIIKSPVSGVIISRDVDVGQTVAASLSAPTLFRIAEDLKKMQIETSISEADIGIIRLNQNVIFDVDAFPKQDFNGRIKQIRLNPTTEQNVVTYNVIIEIENEDLKLLPGMTAYVSIVVEEIKDILKVSNLVFRFNPNEKALREMGVSKIPNFDKKTEATLYVMRKNKVEPIVVKKGLSDISYTEIVSDKIKDGDIVLSDYLYESGKKK